ncbi:MAG TPA: ABC transporter substrate-binding protein [Acidimicrobiales bacterium]|nr:ABC transporter substrate-binding protein [Acidimicrobiales bacterium]
MENWRPRPRLRSLGATLALALIAISCAGGSQGANNRPGTGVPVSGGRLVVGTQAEVDGFDPTKNRWDANGYLYATTVYDSLTAFGADREVHPYLARSIDHNADYTEWTIKIRPGIHFHNGDPLTADDVAFDLNAEKSSLLTGPELAPIASIAKVDDQTVSVKMKAPWVPFPIYLAGQPGFIPSPKTLKDPNGSLHPIGTGPFIFKEWVPGNHFIAVKNPNYWQKGKPYLDQIEYRTITEETSRIASLDSGAIDMLYTSDTQSIVTLRSEKSVVTTDDSKKGERASTFVMLNTAKAPLNDIRVRQALAYATDPKRIIDAIGNSLLPTADSPFGATSAYHVDNVGYPHYDPQKAKQLVAEYEHDTGHKISFQLGTTNTARNLSINQYIQDMWRQVGIQVDLVQVEQSQYILNALEGNYQAYAFIMFGEPDPDADYVWWSSQTAAPIGQLALNFPRNKDPQIDQDLQTGRVSSDPAARKAAYQDISRRLAIDVPYVWISGLINAIATKPSVHGVQPPELPDGGGQALLPTPLNFAPMNLWRS